jgi:hypothetical protein
MDLRARIAAQFGAEDRHELEVPEWGEPGKPLVIYFTRATLRQISEASQLSNGDPFVMNARLVCRKAVDADGKPLFKMAEAQFLLDNADPAVVARIANAISGGVSAEQAEKN